MKKCDKSLIEVWEWKEKVYQDVKDLKAEEYVEKIGKDAGKFFRTIELTSGFSLR
ncbi:MAG: hypothetical protein HYV59_05505 [Planctomycetes bacterium]|nr:hypothetical protein [Planctomycetota bacterium]